MSKVIFYKICEAENSLWKITLLCAFFGKCDKCELIMFTSYLYMFTSYLYMFTSYLYMFTSYLYVSAAPGQLKCNSLPPGF